MSAGALPVRTAGHGWQLILADLALILFLLALSGQLAVIDADLDERAEVVGLSKMEPVRTRAVEIAAAQALYRPVPGGPTLGAWLSSQQLDPRSTLTVFARYRSGDQTTAWSSARALVDEAVESGVATRVIIAQGAESDLYASLAYDAAQSYENGS